jgi:lipoprotein-anchoring transpeptidase ErfK/SrfK
MKSYRSGRWAAALAAAAVSVAVSTGMASAQSVTWDWGGGSVTGGAGKEVVSFPASAGKPGDVIVSFGDRRLYFVTSPGQALAYPIAIPREQSRWSGVTSVSSKRENLSWTPTPTMRKENPRLPNWVPGGHPMNPLGVRALYLGSSAYRIHGTDAPWTIGSAVSKGCVRMYNQDVLDLYPRVRVGAKVTVTWNKYSSSAVASAAPSSFWGSGDEATEERTARQRRTVKQVRKQQPRPAMANAGASE